MYLLSVLNQKQVLTRKFAFESNNFLFSVGIDYSDIPSTRKCFKFTIYSKSLGPLKTLGNSSDFE